MRHASVSGVLVTCGSELQTVVPEDEDAVRCDENAWPKTACIFPLSLPFIIRGWKLNIYKEMLSIVETLASVTQEHYLRGKF